jgi:hypothetical protein
LEDVVDEGWWKMVTIEDMDINGGPPTSSRETSVWKNDSIS